MEELREKIERYKNEAIAEIAKNNEVDKIEKRRRAWIKLPKYLVMTFDNDNKSLPEVTKKCRYFVDNFDNYKANDVGLLLWGETGSGKTYMAAAIANELITRGYKAGITNLSDIIRGQMDFDNADYNLRKLLEFDCLVIDDLGVNRQTPYADEVVQLFVDKCIGKVILVVTTNYTKKVMQEIINSQNLESLAYARLFSRILGNCESVLVTGTDNRNNALQEKLRRIHK